ncbi:Holliday junction resolvase Hjc [Methanopyrus sp.]
MSYRRGADFERQLVHYLREHGGEAVRVAGSGGAVDVVGYAPAMGHVAIECKVRHDDRLYVEKEEIENLTTFAERFHAEPLIAWKPPHVRTGLPLNAVLFPPDLMEERERTYVIDLETALEEGIDATRLVTRPLDHYRR